MAFWQGKKVLITGHTGFKGSWLSLWLQILGAEVIGYALEPPTEPSLFELASVEEGILSVKGDIRDKERILRLLQDYRPEIVFHLAAQPIVRKAYKNPVETFETNIMGTVNVLEAIRKTECVRALVNITSDKCYENKEWIWGYRENDPMGGFDPYSSSKGCSELITAAYRNSYFNPQVYEQHKVAVATARAGNVIGGGDWAEDRLIPDIIRAFINNKPVIIRNPNSIRPWQHVLEPLRGYILLAEKLFNSGVEYAGAWNFGPYDQDALTVGSVVEKMIALWGDGARWEYDSDDHPHEANYLKLDSSKARQVLKWQPMLSINQSLSWTVDWYKNYNSKINIREFSIKQIKNYQDMIEASKS